MTDAIALIDRLAQQHSLTLAEYQTLIEAECEETRTYAAQRAAAVRQAIYGTDIFLRGLIEVTSYCRNDCYYCGIRKSNQACQRYLLSDKDILTCCAEGYQLGFRTFVLQGGEGILPVPRVCALVSAIKARYPDCAVTLSLGEYSREEYQQMFDAGADRYLLRHETANQAHYEKLHPASMSFAHRMQCLQDLKDIGFQVGCGFMVGSPYQTSACLAKDLKFIETFQPHMCGIGPFIPHHDTQFRGEPAGRVDQTCYLLSLLRLMRPNLLLPATTALGTLDPIGREKGILAGGNVVMPNLSPVAVRKKYALYDNKICTGEESAQCRGCLARRMDTIHYHLVTDRGDMRTA